MGINVIDETLERASGVKQLIGRPRKLCSVRKRSGRDNCFFCAKAKRQLQSAQPEQKSTNFMMMSHIIFYFALFITRNYCYLYYNGKGNRDVLNKV
ncbi:hypothetical protein [Lysinibacillus sp. fls2-241-R2A-57]|uniref:hypothetical protein n=1 Tax=Lysinibacillus sp. fls2-241-R2A-57 TaxID=3040292 RepID=UPI002556B2A2|nr:hypothetical protein [Lysinibacillus sp. fls2-241-R2A-57]